MLSIISTNLYKHATILKQGLLCHDSYFTDSTSFYKISILQRIPCHRLSVCTTHENEQITAISLQTESQKKCLKIHLLYNLTPSIIKLKSPWKGMSQGKCDDVLDYLIPGFWREGFLDAVVGSPGLRALMLKLKALALWWRMHREPQRLALILVNISEKLSEADGIVFTICYMDTKTLVSGVWEALEVCGNGLKQSYSH